MKIIKKNLLYAKRLASTSYVMAEQIKKLIGNVPVSVTPFGVDINLFRKIPEIKHEGFIVGTVKTLSPKYGIDIIIKAFRIFCQRVEVTDSVKLVIYGKGESEQELRELCRNEEIEDKVYFGGFISNDKVPQILNGMDVCCFGSRMDSESFGVRNTCDCNRCRWFYGSNLDARERFHCTSRCTGRNGRIHFRIIPFSSAKRVYREKWKKASLTEL